MFLADTFHCSEGLHDYWLFLIVSITLTQQEERSSEMQSLTLRFRGKASPEANRVEPGAMSHEGLANKHGANVVCLRRP